MGAGAIIQSASPAAVIESFAAPTAPRMLADFDGDGRTDVSVFRPSDGVWYVLRSTGGFAGAGWGLASDQLVPGDYDGDRKTDLAVFRPSLDGSLPDYYILNSSNSTVSYLSWGVPGDVPVAGDFDGDGKADEAIFRPGENRFWVRQSSNGGILLSRAFADTIPVAGDFDADGKTDFATYGNGRWSISHSSTNHQSGIVDFWGVATDKIVAADYDGDLRTDLAVYRPSDGIWYIKGSSGVNRYVQFGISTDVPVTGDYDGDSRSDIAVYRGGVWYINRSSGGFLGLEFGLASDVPLPKP